MKNIWIFNHYAVKPEHGALLRHYNFSKYLVNLGYSVNVFAASSVHNADINLIDGKSSYVIDNSEKMTFIYIRARDYISNGITRIRNMIDYYRGLFRVYKNFDPPDVIYASSVHPLTCWAGIKIAKRLKIPCVCEIRDLWPESIVAYQGLSPYHPIILLLRMFEKQIYYKCDALIFTMQGGMDYIRGRNWDKHIDMSKIYHINNGVDLSEFDKNLNTYKIKDDDLCNSALFNIVYTGSVRLVNNLGLIVDTAKILSELGYHQIKFLIWGEGNEREALSLKVENEGIHNIVFKGYVEKKYIPFIVCNADLNLLHWEDSEVLKYGVSYNKLFDYLAAGKPIFSTVKPNYSILINEKCGIETEGNSAEDFAKGILSIYNMSEQQKKSMGENAKKVAAKYDFKELTKKLIQVLKSV